MVEITLSSTIKSKRVHRVHMPKYSVYVNKEQDEILKEYGKQLVKEGHINEPIKRYKVIKFILNQVTKSLKNKLTTQSKIIDENTPIEKEQPEQLQVDEEKLKGTVAYELYKKIR